MSGLYFIFLLLSVISAAWGLYRKRWPLVLFIIGLAPLAGVLLEVLFQNSPPGRMNILVFAMMLWLIAAYLQWRSRRPKVSAAPPILSEPSSAPSDAPTQSHEGGIQQITDKARNGNAEAQFQLAALYDNGRGVPQDHAQAFAWCQKAADSGLAGAQYWLGKKYLSGEGTAANKNKAMSYFRKAADQGLAEAKDELLRLQT